MAFFNCVQIYITHYLLFFSSLFINPYAYFLQSYSFILALFGLSIGSFSFSLESFSGGFLLLLLFLFFLVSVCYYWILSAFICLRMCFRSPSFCNIISAGLRVFCCHLFFSRNASTVSSCFSSYCYKHSCYFHCSGQKYTFFLCLLLRICLSRA